MLEYKARWYGSQLIVVPWAALNLRTYGLATLNGPTGSSPGSNACGDPSGGGTALGRSTSHRSKKQEVAGHLDLLLK